MYIGVKAVQPRPDFRLLLTFDNEEQRIFDVTPYLEVGVFRDLRDIALFDTAHVAFDTVEWANGADLCPETLYDESLPLQHDVNATNAA